MLVNSAARCELLLWPAVTSDEKSLQRMAGRILALAENDPGVNGDQQDQDFHGFVRSEVTRGYLSEDLVELISPRYQRYNPLRSRSGDAAVRHPKRTDEFRCFRIGQICRRNIVENLEQVATDRRNSVFRIPGGGQECLRCQTCSVLRAVRNESPLIVRAPKLLPRAATVPRKAVTV